MTTASEPTAGGPTPASYEAALSELESLVASMEAGRMPLEGLLQGYRRGSELLGYCRSKLESVEQQIKIIEDGQVRNWSGQA